MVHDPLSPSGALRTRTGAAVAAVAALAVAYSVVVAQLVLGALVGFGLPVGLYLTYRTLAVLDSIADAAQRLAVARERETSDASAARTASSNRCTERE
ncbi:MAG: hypothetical protein ACOCRD_01030 [Halorubrum sp.]